MKFYTEIANYYDEIFKQDEDQIKMLEELAGEPIKKILDVASGTGNPAIHLRNIGHMVTAIDLNSKMIDTLKSKNLKVLSYVMNMLNIDKLNEQFDLIYCVGNSLVHLEDYGEVECFLKRAYNSLSRGGKLMIQIINYDRILDKNVKSLPTIENEERGLTFERYYDYEPDRDKVAFKTVLKTQVSEYGNKVYLLPIRKDKLDELFKYAGFKDIKYYGSFKKDEFDKENSFHLIAVAERI